MGHMFICDVRSRYISNTRSACLNDSSPVELVYKYTSAEIVDPGDTRFRSAVASDNHDVSQSRFIVFVSSSYLIAPTTLGQVCLIILGVGDDYCYLVKRVCLERVWNFFHLHIFHERSVF